MGLPHLALCHARAEEPFASEKGGVTYVSVRTTRSCWRRSRQQAFNASMGYEISNIAPVARRSSMSLLPLIVMSISDLLCLGLS